MAGPLEVSLAGYTFQLPQPPSWLPWDSWSLEALLFALVVTYLANIVLGRRSNGQIARSWARELSATDGVLERNFASIGPEDPKVALDASTGVVRLSGCEFAIPASGRRNVSRFEAYFFLQRRQDVLGFLLGSLGGTKDEVEFRVPLPEAATQPSAFAVGDAKLIKHLVETEEDLKAYAKATSLEPGKLTGFPADQKLRRRLGAVAENSAFLHDVVRSAVVAAAAAIAASEAGGSGGGGGGAATRKGFSTPALAWEALVKHLRYVHVTDSFPRGEEKGMVLVVLSLPAEPAPAALELGAALAVALADAVADARVPPDAARKALAARRATPVASAKEEAGGRDVAAQLARERKAAAERERLAKLTPAARAKELERKERIAMKRNMRGMVKRA